MDTHGFEDVAARFDRALRKLFQSSPPSLVEELAGGVRFRHALNTDLPKIFERRADLVLLMEDGSLFHIEFQSTNRADMAWRMLEYFVLIQRDRQSPMRQLVLYCGAAPMRMPSGLTLPNLTFEYDLRDIREWEGEEMARSDRMSDRVLAILGHTENPRRLVRTVLRGIARLEEPSREKAGTFLAALNGLRNFGSIIKQEAAKVPLTIDWSKNEIIQSVLETARAEALEQGKRALAQELVERAIMRFGAMPMWAKQRIEAASLEELRGWLDKRETATRVTDLIPRR